MKRTCIALLLLCYSVCSWTQSQTQKKVYHLYFKLEQNIIGCGALFYGIHKVVLRSKSNFDFEGYNQLGLNHPRINFLDRSAINNFNPKAAKHSDYFRYAAYYLPAILLTTKTGRRHWKELGVMYAQTFIINTSLTKMVKTLSSRRRPYTYNSNIRYTDELEQTATRSFFSGHASHVASLSFFTATVLDDLFPESKIKWIAYGFATAMTGATSYLRYRAGMHFPTDVIVGSAVGAFIGIIIPKLHKLNTQNLKLGLWTQNEAIGLGLTAQF